MKLPENGFEPLEAIKTRLDPAILRFSEFVEALQLFKNERCPVKGLTYKQSDDKRSCDVWYLGLHIVFQLRPIPLETPKYVAKVVCVLDADESPVLGEIMITRRGETDIEVSDHEEAVDLAQKSVEIVAYFIGRAIESL